MTLARNVPIFIQDSSVTVDRVLHPGSVVDVSGDHFVAELEDPRLPIEVGDTPFVYFHKSLDFCKQSVRVVELSRREASIARELPRRLKVRSLLAFVEIPSINGA